MKVYSVAIINDDGYVVGDGCATTSQVCTDALRSVVDKI